MATAPERTYPSELPAPALRQTVVFPLTIHPADVRFVPVATLEEALEVSLPREPPAP